MTPGEGGLPWVWGATADEASRHYPADDVVAARAPGRPLLRMTRAVTADAPPEACWRWLCQLAVAPYSYDLVDNLGRPSPRTLTPGADRLVPGQRMVKVYELLEVDEGRSWTGVTTAAGSLPFGPLAATYAAEPLAGAGGRGGTRTRLVCRMTLPGGGPLVRAKASALAWGDVPMVRKQLRTLASYAGSGRAGSDRQG
ncbi:hypothetical protein [Nocardioides sp. AX2bis]|uniref:hypothetical protein n=1 Tax=Nocardioides sp. AX2bis TaxID=2653157 RepID=UPI0012EFEF6B|nr:hypothetical protein [Nocardioides sp. AX2bis]VXC30417.1 conserved hypothetical protein [Nocardioides sp. AX2bis]